MNKALLAFSFLFISTATLAQRFSHYNTGTLYESFENPSQGVFIADTTRTIAFNFLVPNLNTFGYLKGNAQTTLKSRAFTGRYNNDALQIGQARPNNILVNANVYLAMIRILSNQNGDQELGASIQTKGNGRGNLTDETFAFFNGSQAFAPGTRYDNIFNGSAYYESYHQFSLTYREKATRNLSLGIKLSALLGIAYNKITVDGSTLTFDPTADNATWYMHGSYLSSFEPGQFGRKDLFSFKNPGASVSLGATYKTDDNFTIQGNIKDLGFIRWSDNFRASYFGNATTVEGLRTGSREKNVINALSRLVEKAPIRYANYIPIEGRAEISVSKKFTGSVISYTPTAIVAKALYHGGSTAALVNHIQYSNFILTATGIYDYNHVLSLGGQLMFKAPNVEFYVGSEQLSQSANMLSANNKNQSAIEKNMPYSGTSVFLGFSVKFGRMFERWRNTSYIPTGGEPGPLGRFWTRLFDR
ncbi:DUF5723 family protein [Mucilaginibacter lacusdianchii]|uniref:DUF5723 family protein n=1 Tax=Mucilaginibacter lacusdianchii TaxID=2684211 RepID=UPI00131CBD4F|nr:DUF5723 family protein [Mucilaginibacter sp. JXJ CY 39]